MTKKLMTILLCLAMMAAMMTGCGNTAIRQYDAEDAETPAEDTAAAEEPAEDTAEPEPTATPDPGLGPEAYDADTVVATVNGADVTWREYYYWLSYYVEYSDYLAAMGAFTYTDSWDSSDISSVHNNGEVVRISAWDNLSQFRALEAMAQELDVTLDEADQEQIQSNFEQSADQYGDGDGDCTDQEITAYEGYLGEQFVDRAFFDRMTGLGILSNKVFNALYGGEDAADYPDEDVLSYAEEAGLMAAKHILLMTVDASSGEALSDEEIAEKKETIDQLYMQLSEKKDDPEALEALFDELMEEHSEDTGLAMYPDGYLFTEGEMVPAFEEATKALEEYGLSEPVQSDFGWHIILRLPIDPESAVMDTAGNPSTVRVNAANADFYDRLLAASDSADVQWKEDFETVDIGAIFGQR